jgi:hypothetical protein
MESFPELQRQTEAEELKCRSSIVSEKINPEEQYQKASELKTINGFAVELDRFLARSCDNTPPPTGQDKIFSDGTSAFSFLLWASLDYYNARQSSPRRRDSRPRERILILPPRPAVLRWDAYVEALIRRGFPQAACLL